MLEKLTNIYNTLCMVETKGQSTIYMAASLAHLREIIEQAQAETSMPAETE